MTTHSLREAPRPLTARPSSGPLRIYTGHLLRKHLRMAVFWTIGFSVYTVLILAAFPSLRDSGALSVENYPDAMLEAFNILDMGVINNYIEAQVTSIAPLVIAFFPIMAFAGVIAGAEERGALDITLGPPLPRRDLVLSSWIAIAILLAGMLLATSLATWITVQLIDAELPLGHVLEGFLNIFPITMAFGSLALALSAKLRSRGAVIGLSFAAVFLMYLIDVIGKMSPDLADLRWLSAFRYYGSAIMNGLDWGNIAVLTVAAVGLLAAAAALFERRDIYT